MKNNDAGEWRGSTDFQHVAEGNGVLFNLSCQLHKDDLFQYQKYGKATVMKRV